MGDVTFSELTQTEFGFTVNQLIKKLGVDDPNKPNELRHGNRTRSRIYADPHHNPIIHSWGWEEKSTSRRIDTLSFPDGSDNLVLGFLSDISPKTKRKIIGLGLDNEGRFTNRLELLREQTSIPKP